MSKAGEMIIEGLKEALEVSKCAHDFEYLRDAGHHGVIGRCIRCKCRFTAWPTTVHYDEIVAARDRQRQS